MQNVYFRQWQLFMSRRTAQMEILNPLRVKSIEGGSTLLLDAVVWKNRKVAIDKGFSSVTID